MSVVNYSYIEVGFIVILLHGCPLDSSQQGSISRTHPQLSPHESLNTEASICIGTTYRIALPFSVNQSMKNTDVQHNYHELHAFLDHEKFCRFCWWTHELIISICCAALFHLLKMTFIRFFVFFLNHFISTSKLDVIFLLLLFMHLLLQYMHTVKAHQCILFSLLSARSHWSRLWAEVYRTSRRKALNTGITFIDYTQVIG